MSAQGWAQGLSVRDTQRVVSIVRERCGVWRPDTLGVWQLTTRTLPRQDYAARCAAVRAEVGL